MRLNVQHGTQPIAGNRSRRYNAIVIPGNRDETITSTGASWRLLPPLPADAIAVGVLALADLTAHEATTEKVVHQLVVHDGSIPKGAEQRAAA